MRLVIGNKNYSSWSLRPWLLMRQFGLSFEELLLPLDTPEFRERVPALSPSGRVPVLHDGGRVIWDSLAICEYVNEVHLNGRGWPADPGRRALARSAAAEMHSGFAALRAQLPMNCRRQPSGPCWDAAAEADIRRVQALWAELRREAGEGPFLLGDFGIVDAMFAPVVIRFRSYGVPLSATAAAWCETMAALPAMQAWIEAGVREPWRVGADER